MYYELPGRSGDGIASTNASCQEERLSGPACRLLCGSRSPGEIMSLLPLQTPVLSHWGLSAGLGGIEDLAYGCSLFWGRRTSVGVVLWSMAVAFTVVQ